jgi:Outer membrane lipoprotein-sorting protein
MKLKRQIAILLATLALAHQSPANAAGRSPTASPTEAIATSTSLLSGKENVSDGETFLRQLMDRVRNAKDYVYDTTLIANLKGKPVSEQGRFYFKSPNMIRFEVTAAKGRTGSVVVRQPDGKIRAKAGGLLGGITLTLSPDSRLLRTANGINILDSDLVSLMQRFREQAKGQRKILTTKSPTRVTGYENIYIVELLNNDFVVERIIVDAARQLPVEWLLFEENKLQSYVKFTSLKMNSGNAEDLFYLEKDKSSAKGFEDGLTSLSDRLMIQAHTAGGALPLNSVNLRDVTDILSILRRQADALSRDSLSDGIASTSSSSVFEMEGSQPSSTNNAPPSGWSKDGREVLLLRLSSMESLLAPVLSLSKSFAAPGLSADLAPIGEQWRVSADNIDRSTARLVRLFEEDSVYQSNIEAEAKNIRDEADKLKTLAEHAYKSVD